MAGDWPVTDPPRLAGRPWSVLTCLEEERLTCGPEKCLSPWGAGPAQNGPAGPGGAFSVLRVTAQMAQTLP